MEIKIYITDTFGREDSLTSKVDSKEEAVANMREITRCWFSDVSFPLGVEHVTIKSRVVGILEGREITILEETSLFSMLDRAFIKKKRHEEDVAFLKETAEIVTQVKVRAEVSDNFGHSGTLLYAAADTETAIDVVGRMVVDWFHQQSYPETARQAVVSAVVYIRSNAAEEQKSCLSVKCAVKHAAHPRFDGQSFAA